MGTHRLDTLLFETERRTSNFLTLTLMNFDDLNIRLTDVSSLDLVETGAASDAGLLIALHVPKWLCGITKCGFSPLREDHIEKKPRRWTFCYDWIFFVFCR